MNRPKLELIVGGFQDAEGNLHDVYAYTVGSMCVFDPYSSECGRFNADPLKDYGLTPEDVQALNDANMALLGFVPKAGS